MSGFKEHLDKAPNMPVEDDRPPNGWKVCLPILGIIAACAVAAGLFTLSTWWVVSSGADRRWITAAALVYGFSIIGFVMLGTRSMQEATQMKPSAAMRRYNRRVLIAMCFYIAGLVLAISAFKELKPGGALAYVLALAPSLPLVAVIAAMGLYLREETDEFQRVLMLHSALIGTCILLTVATVWGFMEMFKLVPHAPTWAAFPLWAIGLGVGRGILAGRYR